MATKIKNRDTLASALDKLIEEGPPCTWEYLERLGNEHSNRLGLKTRCTPRIIKAHIKYRQIKDSNYLGRRYFNGKGIFINESRCPHCDTIFYRGTEFPDRPRRNHLPNPKGKVTVQQMKEISDYNHQVDLEDFWRYNSDRYTASLCDNCLDEYRSEVERDNLFDLGSDYERGGYPGLESCDYRGG